MELDFDNDEFESFLKSKADQYTMYPSEKCWKGISFILHSRSRWITIGGSLLLISTFFFFGGPFLNSKSTASQVGLPESGPVITSISGSRSTPLLPVSPENVRESVAVAGKIVSGNKDLFFTPSRQHRAFGQALGSADASTFTIEALTVTSQTDTDAHVFDLSIDQNTEHGEITSVESHGNAMNAIIDEANSLKAKEIGKLPPAIPTEDVTKKSVNWLQEIAALKLSAPKKNSFSLQFYFSPTVSYRRLVDNSGVKTAMANGSYQTASVASINRFVDHKPAIGVELGSNIIYSVGRSLTLKTGLQMNYSRYTIKAYKSYPEKAEIALNSVGMRTPDTIVTTTNVRNFNGVSPEQLENQYLQLSVPVAAELLVIGGKNLQFSIAGTVQPSYLLFNDTYLLSTDYQHYAKEPSLIRKWNVHTSAEAFIAYKSGSVRWQVGPQFRYQLMSSYNERYPIKEYLMEYGVKFGIVKTLK